MPTRIAWDDRVATRTGAGSAPGGPAAGADALPQPAGLLGRGHAVVELAEPRQPSQQLGPLFTNRHFKKGHVALLDRSVDLWRAPRGGNDANQNDLGDFVANDIFCGGRGGTVGLPVAPSWPATERLFGWINSPR